jgi:hypothetical protein
MSRIAPGTQRANQAPVNNQAKPQDKDMLDNKEKESNKKEVAGPSTATPQSNTLPG